MKQDINESTTVYDYTIKFLSHHNSWTLASNSGVKNGGCGGGGPLLVSQEKLSIADGTYIPGGNNCGKQSFA